MANYTTSADLVNDVLFRAGEPDDTTSDFYDQAIRYLNRAYQALWRGGGELSPDISEQWWWLTKYGNGTLTLLPVEDDGTVIVTNGSAGITFSAIPTRVIAGVVTNVSLQTWHFKVDNHADVFRINTHASGLQTATLDSVYTGTTDTAAGYRAFKLDYTLASDVLEITSPMRAFQGGIDGGNIIELVAPSVLSEKWPLEQIQPGVPKNYAKIALDDTPLQVVRFSHYGGTSDTELIRIDYDYIYKPADIADDASEIALPREYRKVLCDWALSFLLKDKEDDRYAAIVGLAQAGLRQMELENRRRQVRQGSQGRIFPRAGSRLNARGPLRTSSGLLITSR